MVAVRLIAWQAIVRIRKGIECLCTYQSIRRGTVDINLHAEVKPGIAEEGSKSRRKAMFLPLLHARLDIRMALDQKEEGDKRGKQLNSGGCLLGFLVHCAFLQNAKKVD